MKLKKNHLRKTSSSDLIKRKKRNKRRDISSDNLFTFASIKKSKFNFLDVVMEKNNFKQERRISINNPPSFTQLISNFIEQDKLDFKGLEDEKDELNKKISHIKSIKEKKQMPLKNNDNLSQKKDNLKNDNS